MPQHMFVFSRSGRVQCHCVIAIERLGNITHVVRNKGYGTLHRTRRELPQGFFSLYGADHMLWSAALSSADPCHEVGTME